MGDISNKRKKEPPSNGGIIYPTTPTKSDKIIQPVLTPLDPAFDSPRFFLFMGLTQEIYNKNLSVQELANKLQLFQTKNQLYLHSQLLDNYHPLYVCEIKKTLFDILNYRLDLIVNNMDPKNTWLWWGVPSIHLEDTFSLTETGRQVYQTLKNHPQNKHLVDKITGFYQTYL